MCPVIMEKLAREKGGLRMDDNHTVTVMDVAEFERQRRERLAALDEVLNLFRGTDLPPVSDIIAMVDWVLTGTPDVAQGNDRITSQRYHLHQVQP